MKLKKFICLMMISIFPLALAGCGSESFTNGSITLSLTATDTTIGQFDVQATAVFSKPALNVPITFTWIKKSPSDPTGALPENSGSVTVGTNDTGISKHLFSVGQTAENISFTVTARTGDVSDTQSVPIPALAP